MTIVTGFAGICLAIGLLFNALGIIGILRFPDVYTRLHADTKATTFGSIFTTLSVIVFSLGLYATGEGDENVLRESFLIPLATSCCQSSLPDLRSKHIASRDSLAISVDDTNTRSCQTTGVAADVPGKSTLQATFSVRLHSVGRFFSSVEPLKNGPRH